MQYKGIDIPDTPDGWELYDVVGAPEAARALVQASKEAVDMLEDAKMKDFKETIGKASQHIYAVCEKHAKQGAADSEGHYHARHVVIDAAKHIGGIEVDPWSL